MEFEQLSYSPLKVQGHLFPDFAGAWWLGVLSFCSFALNMGGADEGLGDSGSHGAGATGVAIMVSHSTGVKRTKAG